MRDSAAVSGRVTPLDGATVDFRLFGPDDLACSGPPVFESLGGPYGPAAELVESVAFTPTQPGPYRWIAGYSGDRNNSPVSGVCGEAGETVLVEPAPPAPQTPGQDPDPATAGYCFRRRATIVAARGQRSSPERRAPTSSSAAPPGRRSTGAAATTSSAPAAATTVCAAAAAPTSCAARPATTCAPAAAPIVRRAATAPTASTGAPATTGSTSRSSAATGATGVGGAGRDRIRTAGGAADIVDCGADRDSLVRDPEDRPRRCERVTRA